MSAADDRREDLQWLADHWERRLGLSQATLRRWCERYDPDVYARLKLNEERRRCA